MVDTAVPRKRRVLVVLLPAEIKYPTKQFKEERVSFGSQFKVLSIVMGKPWWQECEGVCHITYVVRRQKEMNAVPSSLLTITPIL